MPASSCSCGKLRWWRGKGDGGGGGGGEEEGVLMYAVLCDRFYDTESDVVDR